MCGNFCVVTHGGRVTGATPKMPIDTVGNPHFEDFANPADASTTKTHHLLGLIPQIRQASLTADFIGKLNSALRKRIRESGNGESFYSKQRFPPSEKSENKRVEAKTELFGKILNF